MKSIFNTQGLTIIALVLLMAAGCKKNNPSAPAWQQYQLSSLADSTQAPAAFTYDAEGKLIKFYGGTTSYDFYYSGSTLIARTYTNSGSLQNVDSFFYDASGRIIEVLDYSASYVKQDSALFAYNGDNTVNSVIVGNVSGVGNALYEYSYTNGQLTSRTDYAQQVGGDFEKTEKTEILGYDSNPNLLYGIYQKYLFDQFNFFFFVWAGPNNCTSIKQTNYDASTGQIDALYSATLTYGYNANTLPVKMTIVQGNTTLLYSFQYQHI